MALCGVLPSTAGHAQQADTLLPPPVREPRGQPWPARSRTGVALANLEGPEENLPSEDTAQGLAAHELRRLGLRPKQRAVADLSRWPLEPATPAQVDPQRLARALAELCPPGPATPRIDTMAKEVIAAAREFDIDPMLLGALAYHQSHCRADARTPWGVGLTMINRGLLPPGLARGVLEYRMPGARGRMNRLVFAPPQPWASGALLDPATNLYTAAALLRMWHDQCPAIDAGFRSEPHRHYVSHFIWGDRVRGAGPEDGVLTARRRLIQYYAQPSASAQVHLQSLDFASPLDGPPRIVTSGLGEARDHGRRAHAGVDFFAQWGEPVRAVAAGVVTRAGCDLSTGELIDLPPLRAALVRDRDFGPRGLFVEITHPNGYRSIYAHLASYTVEKGARIQRGQLLGYVGLSGVHESDPHLHFGLFDGARVVDPRDALAPYLFAPQLEQREATARPAAGAVTATETAGHTLQRVPSWPATAAAP